MNFIKNHIPRRAKICEPITRLTKKDVKFVWGEEQQQVFDKLKAVVLEAILLTYPNPNRPFDIYPNASSMYAMGVVLAQDRKIISTFSRKFNDAQLKHTVMGQEILAAVEACKHFEQIIWGCKIRIHMDHQNLTHDGTVQVNLRQQRARILLDLEIGATFIHIEGMDNTAADGLSQLEMSDDKPTEIANEIFAILQNNLDREESNNFPLDMKCIMIAQRSDNEIQQRINSGKLSAKIGTKIINGGEVTAINGLVWVPKEAQQQIVEWYHSNLQHTGITRTINSIGQTFTWKGLRPMVEQQVLSCDSCQRNKSTNKKSYGKIPLTPALHDKNPWEIVHVDCCGPWKVRWYNEEKGKTRSLDIHLLSMVEACTGWSEFARVKSASSIATATAFDKGWLCHYPRPHKVVHDNGPEFMGCEFKEMLDTYGIESKPNNQKSDGQRNSRTHPRHTWGATPSHSF